MFENIKEYYIMGFGNLGKYLEVFFKDYGEMTFRGFIDNKQEGTANVIIYKPENVPNKNIPVFVGSINYTYEMTVQLRNLGFKNIITFAELTLRYPDLQKYNQSYIGLREDYINNTDKYEKVYKLFADKKSIDILDTIIEYRKTYNVDLYAQIADSPMLQYCDNIAPRNMQVYVDGGAFDGDSVLRAIQNEFEMEKIYFFEPDEASINQAKENLKNINKNIKYLPYGISDKEKVLKFVSNNAFSSHFSEKGNKQVKCVALDDIIEEDRAFIKLDIEGAEYDAILGGEKLFKNKSPFAICVYHKPEDIYRIPFLINEISNNGYKLYLRHYTNNILETVLYGVAND